MANLVVHFEIHASEPQQLIDFYTELLGWRFTRVGEMTYWTIETGEGSAQMNEPGDGINGGLTQREGPKPERDAPVKGNNFVIGVHGSVDEVMAKGLELGGTEEMAAEDWPGIGRCGYLLDPDGNLFGLITPILSDGTNAMDSPIDM